MRVFVAGAGLMGQGIAVDLAKKYDVLVYDISEQAISKARQMVERLKEKYELEGSVDFTTNIRDAKDCDLAVEAVFENLDVKVEVLQKLEEITQSPLCSNTSVICVDDIAEKLKARERFMGVHWMNPPYTMPLVEIILSKYTGENAAVFVSKLLKDIGKETAICRNQSLVNRFNAAVLAEASKMLAEGVSYRDIDRVWKVHLGLLYTLFGPLGNLDYIGLDVVYSASLYLHQRFRDEKFKPPAWLREKVEKGELGIKTGVGIYSYTDFERAYLDRVERIERLLKFLELK